MAGIIASTKSQWLKSFPPIQQKALAAVTTNQLTAYKLGTTTSTASTALAADTELVIPYISANVPYLLMGYLDTTVSTTGGVAFDLNGGSGVASKVNVSSAFIVAAGTVTPGAQMVALSTAPTVNTVLTIAVQIQGIIVFSSPGSLVLRFAQSSAAGTTTLNPYSFLRLEALDAEITA